MKLEEVFGNVSERKMQMKKRFEASPEETAKKKKMEWSDGN